MKKITKIALSSSLGVLLGLVVHQKRKVSLIPRFTKMKSVQDEIKHASPTHPLVFSHRGSPYNSPEHSFQGYDQAIKDGSHFIEQDIWLSKDDILYVTHDNNLKRTTGRNIKVSNSMSKQLDKVKLKNGEHLHRLSAAFEHYGRKIHYIIESKKYLGASNKTEEILSEQLDKYQMNDNVIIQDTKLSGIEYLHSLPNQKDVPYLYLMKALTKRGILKKVHTAPNYITFLAMNLILSSPKIIESIHRRGMLSDVWTAKNYKDNFEAIKIDKVDSIFTNNTKQTRKLLRKFIR